MLFLIICLIFLAIFAAGCYVAFMAPDLLMIRLEVKEQKEVSGPFKLIHRHSRLFLQTMLAVVVLALFMASLLAYKDYSASFDALYFWQKLLCFLLLIVASVLLIVILPYRVVASSRADNIVMRMAMPAFILFSIFCVPVFILSELTAAVLRFFGFMPVPKEKGREYDLETLVQMELEQVAANDHGEEVRMFQNALEFGELDVSQCLVPRTEIVYVTRDSSKQDLVDLFVKSGKSKIIVCDDDLDHIIGYVHSYELFKSKADWTEDILSIPIVPEAMPAAKLMQMLLQEKRSLAVVVDEFGGTTGIVSIEDILEEILGEIEDEHDHSTYTARKTPDGDYLLSARIEVEHVNETFGLSLPESDDYQTIAGLILNSNQRFPKIGDVVKIGEFSFKIIRTTQRKIELVRLSVDEK